MSLPVTFATLAAGNQPLSLFDTEFAAVAALGYIPCAASAGPNNIALTPFASVAPGFVFAAAATSTGAVTLNVSGVGARNGYKWNGLQPANAGDIVSAGIYKAVPLQALNGGSGGFVIDSMGIGPPGAIGAFNNGALEFVIDGGGSAITTGNKGSLYVPFAGIVIAWRVIADQSGSAQVDVLRANFAVPSVSMVGGGTKPNLTASQLNQAVPSGWTSTTFVAGDFISFNVTSAATVTRITVVLEYAKS
jgi:hypothetical protein